ncbi:putative membrane protein [Hephaestia caeni]|uniref:Putative membrane protein n=1 Tax=Hephaestia caeni TaxID=645617 RepID=A0A397NJY9_9SPHN|nr:putative membrane protein [Hephaestia caeni]
MEPVDSPDEPTLPGILSESYQRSFHSGPLPSVDEFRAYGEVVSDAPERILRMAERDQEAKHRIIEKQIIQNSRAVSQGQWMGFTAMIVALGGAIYLASTGHSAVAALLAGPSVLVPIMRFYFHGKHEADQDRAA